MSRDPYSARVRALFSHPEHAGSLEGLPAARIDEQGVCVQFSGSVADGVIVKLRFLAWGCPHLIAAAEAVCAQYEGRPLAELETLRAEELMQSLPVPVEKTGRILVIEDAARALGKTLGTL
jgi:nitrogen fixation NifU-like protein